jgi:hypothetical protein
MYSARIATLSLLMMAACARCGEDAPQTTRAYAGARDASPVDAAHAVDAAADAGSGPVEDLHLIGRFDLTDPAAPRFAWPGSAIGARFYGTGIDLALVDQGTNVFDVTLDQGAPITLATTNGKSTYSLASNLVLGNHDVLIVKRTESQVGLVTFRGFTPKGGKMVPSALPTARKIEVIGASMACGYGVLGKTATCSFSPDTENENVAWGALAAGQLKALHTTIAYSGRGLLRNFDGGTSDVMPDLWLRTFADDQNSTWDFSRWSPDVVVINLGTNDFAKGDPGQAFATAYVAFLKKLRAQYPAALLVVALGTMLTDPSLSLARGYMQSAVTSAKAGGDAKVSFVEVPPQDCNVDGCGCDHHPSTVTQAKMGAAVAAHIKGLTGW